MEKNNHTENTFLSVRDLVVEYTANKEVIHAVNGVSFDIKKGHTLGLVGETGAGKTSIAKAILRILPDTAAHVRNGEVWLEDKNLYSLAEADMLKIRGRKISMIFQDPMTALNPVMRIGRQISEVIELHDKVSKKEAKDRAVKMLEMVGIPGERYEEYPHQFSGGMKQRVVIAMALACNPNLLIADEPTTALDVTIQAQVLDMMHKLQQERDMSMIMITHDLGIVAEVCDEVAVVYAGQVIESGTVEEVFENPAHPYTVGLFGALPNLEEDVDRLSPISGMVPDPSNLPEGCYFSPRCPFAKEECLNTPVELMDIGAGHTCRCIMAAERSGRVVGTC